MHPISDKELDKLFQQRFEEAEYQPSEMVWEKIERKMDEQKKVKSSLPMFIRVAATVVLVAAAALWFYRPVDVIHLQGNDSQETASVQPEVVKPLAASVDEKVTPLKSRRIKYQVSESRVTVPASEENTSTAQIIEPATKQIEVPVANTPARKIAQAEPNEKMKNIKVPAAYQGDQSKLDVTQPDMIASLDASDEEITEQHDVQSGRKIRSIGSLVNFVISKVDRRSDKIIEFKDGAEGSEVTGINLGLVKLKNRN